MPHATKLVSADQLPSIPYCRDTVTQKNNPASPARPTPAETADTGRGGRDWRVGASINTVYPRAVKVDLPFPQRQIYSPRPNR